MLNVRYCNEQNLIRPPRRKLTRLLRLAAPERWRNAEVSVALVDGERMAALNGQYTGREGETDVLAFPLEDPDNPDDPLVGEIVVSASRALEEARARQVSPEDELTLYVLHGALHLMGYHDHTLAQRRKMYARERELLARAGLPNVRRRGCRKRAPGSGHILVKR